jgi:4-hydroxyphenylpyruvate dioxygenase
LPSRRSGDAATPSCGRSSRKRSIATVSLSGTLEDKLETAAAAGFDGIEIFESDLIVSTLSPADVRRRAAELGLEIALYQPFRDFEAVTPDAFDANLRRAECKFAVMEQLGAELMLVCSNVAADAIDDDALAADQLRTMAEHAAAHGMRIAYEALAWGTHVNDYQHAWRIVEAADHPNLGTCLDSFHVLSRGDDPSGIRAIPGDKIYFLQLADAPQLLMDVLQWSRHYRCFPGQGAFDLVAFVGHVLAAGYGGPLSLEVFNDVFRQASPWRVATDAMRSLLALEETVDLAASTLPEAPPLAGYSFIELGVDAIASTQADEVLARMGFRRTGRRRAKPAELWEQGSIRVVTSEALYSGEPGDIVVSAVALASADPDRSVRRAEALLAPRRQGQKGRQLPRIIAPDGTWIAISADDREAVPAWLSDFKEIPSHLPDGLLTHIDHVALSQPFDSFDEATLFYRSVFNLDLRAGQEIAAPHGLVRSRAVTNEDGTVRFVLNVPLLGSGAHTASALAQHIAFACDDIFAVARAMREAGAEFLSIPDNYYDDLAARLEIDEAMLSELRGLDVLYDRNDDGEFLHFYTPIVGWRLFFEVVQRVGGYDAFGAPNSAVRLAAQRNRTARAPVGELTT